MRNSSDEDSEYEEIPEESQTFTDPSPVIDMKRRYFIGKDYSNPYEKDFETLDRFNEGNYFLFHLFLLRIIII
jgi:hypothetical protein